MASDPTSVALPAATGNPPAGVKLTPTGTTVFCSSTVTSRRTVSNPGRLTSRRWVPNDTSRSDNGVCPRPIPSSVTVAPGGSVRTSTQPVPGMVSGTTGAAVAPVDAASTVRVRGCSTSREPTGAVLTGGVSGSAATGMAVSDGVPAMMGVEDLAGAPPAALTGGLPVPAPTSASLNSRSTGSAVAAVALASVVFSALCVSRTWSVGPSFGANARPRKYAIPPTTTAIANTGTTARLHAERRLYVSPA